jgi:hypothetical protein
MPTWLKIASGPITAAPPGPADLNIAVAWAGILCGVLGGAAAGLYFHRDEWLGGYGSWRRRLMRLGHLAFFGIALLNLAFAVTVAQPGWNVSSPVPGLSLAAAQGLMPLLCYLSAWRKPFRHGFVLPVACVLVGVVGLLLGRVIA